MSKKQKKAEASPEAKPSNKKTTTRKHDRQALEDQINQLTESLKRERADADNLRRRHESQMSELQAYVKAEVIKELLPVIDNIERALAHTPDELKEHQYAKGVEGVAKQFRETLQKMHVERIATSGEKFDPTIHEAVSMDDSQAGDTEVVTDELQAGYRLGDQVIRPAMVRVALQ